MKRLVFLILFTPSMGFPQSQSEVQENNLSQSISDAIARIESLTGEDISDILESEFAEPVMQLDPPGFEMADVVMEKGSPGNSFFDNLKFEPVDYGYIVKDRAGGVIDVFGPNTPTLPDPSNPDNILISGYGDVASYQVTRVGAAEYNEALKDIAIGLGEAVEEAAGRGVRAIAQKAQKATTVVAAETLL